MFYAHSSSKPDGEGWQELKEHLQAVAAITSQLSVKIGLPHAGELIGLAHDLGKYSAAFQHYLKNVAGDPAMEMEQAFTLRGSVDHSTAGAQTVANRCRANAWLSEAMSLCIASHHSGLIDCLLPNGEDGLSRRLKKDDGSSHRSEAWEKADLEVRTALEELIVNPDLEAEFAGFMDRIRLLDNDEVIQRFKQGLLLRMLFSCLIDGDRTNTAGFDKPREASLRQHGEYACWQELIDRLERRVATFVPDSPVNRLRGEISDHCLAGAQREKGIFTLTVPTGGGKTLASLRFALGHARTQKMDRIIYVSPYISIVDQNAQVVREILEPSECEFASIVLEHHSNLAEDKETWRASVLAENWDAPVIFTTAVQFLEALFGGGTRSVRRLHAMANAVLIFDEVQTLPVRTIYLFNNAINFLVEQCGTSALLCTATQPLLHEVDKAKGAMRLSEDAELIFDRDRVFRELKRYDTFDETEKAGGWNTVEVSELALAEMAEHGSCLVVVNTKRIALAIYREWGRRVELLDKRMENVRLVHLSTRMCPAHRLEALDRMKQALKVGEPVLCVSTQLIEAGVDIDFATVVRELAGLDSIAQAAGRCNRNGERTTGRVHIVRMTDRLPGALEEIECGQRNAARVLSDWRDENPGRLFELSDPDQMRKFFNHHFFARRNQMAYPVKVDGLRDDTLLQMLGENGMAVEDAEQSGDVRTGFRQSFASAAREFRVIEGQSQGLVVPFGEHGKNLILDLCAAYDLSVEFRLLRRAQRFTVNVFQNEMENLKQKHAAYEAQAGTGILCLHKDFYSDDFGLSLEGGGGMESMIA